MEPDMEDRITALEGRKEERKGILGEYQFQAIPIRNKEFGGARVRIWTKWTCKLEISYPCFIIFGCDFFHNVYEF